jgi:hypothetical protein
MSASWFVFFGGAKSLELSALKRLGKEAKERGTEDVSTFLSWCS